MSNSSNSSSSEPVFRSTMPLKKTSTTTTTYKLNPKPSSSAIPRKSSNLKTPTSKTSSPNLSSQSPTSCKPKNVSFSAEIPRILSRIETLQIVFDRDPTTFRLFDIALYRLEETVHQLSTMLLTLEPDQRRRMDVQGWLEETGRLLYLTKEMVNETFDKNGRITKIWKRMLRVKIEGSWWDNHKTVDLGMALLEHCVKLSRRYQRLVYDLLRAQTEGDED